MLIKSDNKISTVNTLFYDYLENNNITLFEKIFAANIKVHTPASWQEIHNISCDGFDNIKRIDKNFLNAFDVKNVNITKLHDCGNLATVIWHCDGIHHHDFFSFKASNNALSIAGQTTLSFDKRQKINEVWQAWDMWGLLQQIRVADDKYSTFNLSTREKQCLQLLAQGKTAKETAAILNISHRTVESYFENIKVKMGCANKRELLQLL